MEQGRKEEGPRETSRETGAGEGERCAGRGLAETHNHQDADRVSEAQGGHSEGSSEQAAQAQNKEGVAEDSCVSVLPEAHHAHPPSRYSDFVWRARLHVELGADMPKVPRRDTSVAKNRREAATNNIPAIETVCA